MRISDWSSDVCSSDLVGIVGQPAEIAQHAFRPALQQQLGLARIDFADEVAATPEILHAFALQLLLVDRKSVVEGKSVSVRVDLGGRRIIKKKRMSTSDTQNLVHSEPIENRHNN